MKKIILLLAAVFTLGISCVYAEDTEKREPEPYTEAEFPHWALTLRRSEIITLGSLPFTTLGVTFGVGLFKYISGQTSTFPNPFDKTSSYSSSDIQFIVGLSLGVSLVIGLVDFIIHLVINHKKQKETRRVMSTIEVVPAPERAVPEANESPGEENAVF
ncbi:MAG: hypothetical protein J5930_07875 [Treponema sp.]|nr:hypothetical protein [Treponema sp.]